jgi:hypothetical protein
VPTADVRDEILRALRIAEVDAKHLRWPPLESLELLGRCLSPLVVRKIRDRDLGAGGSEQSTNGSSDVARRAGDERFLPR